jgi:arylsulfatase A-like enzyme
MNRRDFLADMIAGAAAVAVLSPREAPAQTTAPRPNVLFIAIDDLNDWIGCLGGHPQVKTPNLDRLAGRGVLFSRAYCSAPACNPSRASLMTGVLPSTSGVYLNGQPWRPVMKDVTPLQESFKRAGYDVLGRGKIYHHGRGEEFFTESGWDTYIPKSGDPLPPTRPVSGIPKTSHFDWGPVSAPNTQMDDTKVTDWCIEQLSRSRQRPLFLACGLFRPHLPWYVPQEWFDLYPLEDIVLPTVNDDDLADIPLAGRRMARPERDHHNVNKHGQWRQAVQGYLASISFTDWNVGRLLDALDQSPYKDNTLIVLWGDHGWHLGEKLHWRKFALWEEATHAPLMFVVPSLTPVGRVCQRPVSFADIYPTLKDICRLPAPSQELEGVSLRPLLAAPEASWERPALTTHGRGNHSVRSEKWRYIRYSDGSEELYDEEKDPLEWTNLAGEAEWSEVKVRLSAWLPKTNAPDAPKKKKGKGKKGGK